MIYLIASITEDYYCDETINIAPDYGYFTNEEDAQRVVDELNAQDEKHYQLALKKYNEARATYDENVKQCQAFEIPSHLIRPFAMAYPRRGDWGVRYRFIGVEEG